MNHPLWTFVFSPLLCVSVLAQLPKHVESLEYPPIARNAPIEGTVYVSVTISPDGRVASARTTSGHPLLKREAEEGVSKWLFENSSGENVSQPVEFTFKLDEKPLKNACTRTHFDLPGHVIVISNRPPTRVYETPIKPKEH